MYIACLGGKDADVRKRSNSHVRAHTGNATDWLTHTPTGVELMAGTKLDENIRKNNLLHTHTHTHTHTHIVDK